VAQELKPTGQAQPGVPGSESQAGLDAATQSLVNALRVSFWILGFFIGLLAVLFWLQGIYTVQPGEKKLVLRFGVADISRVMDEGIHYHIPYIEDIVVVRTEQRRLDVNTFWPKLTEEARKRIAEGKEKLPEDYVPGAEGGYLLTGDLNVLESRWTINYRVPQDNKEAIVRYFAAFGKDPEEQRAKEEALVRGLFQAALVREVAHMLVFDAYLYRKSELRDNVQARLAAALEHMNCGLRVDNVSLTHIRPPKQLLTAFNARTEAEQNRERLVEEAKKERVRILTDAGGSQIGVRLGDAIAEWWRAKELAELTGPEADAARKEYEAEYGEPPAVRMARLEKEIDNLMSDQDRRAGAIKRILADAEAYRQEVVNRAEGDAKRLKELLASGPENLRVYLEFTRLDALEKSVGNSLELFLIRQLDAPDTELELIMNRSAKVLKAKTRYKETR